MGYNIYFIIHSEAKSGDDATDRWTVKVSIKQDPMLDKWNGTYGINNATAYVKGFEKGNPYEVTKAVLTMANGTVNSRIKFEDLHETNQYNQKKYKVTLQIGEMIEQNGNYAHNINIIHTGYVEGGV